MPTLHGRKDAIYKPFSVNYQKKKSVLDAFVHQGRPLSSSN